MNAFLGVEIFSDCKSCQDTKPDSMCCQTLSDNECKCYNEVRRVDKLKYWCNLNGGYLCEVE